MRGDAGSGLRGPRLRLRFAQGGGAAFIEFYRVRGGLFMQMSCWAPMPPVGPWARRWGGGDLVSAMTGQCCAVGVHEVLQDPRAESGRGDGRSGREHRGEPEFAG